MVAISDKVKEELKKPLGRLAKSCANLKGRIISIGDVCTIALIKEGITPHLAVFDHRSMRKPLREGDIRILGTLARTASYKNPAGTISEEIMRDARMLLGKGGAVLIDGEEDLTALAFILASGEGDKIVYGQPGEGVVIVEPTGKLKKRIKGWLASSTALGHEV